MLVLQDGYKAYSQLNIDIHTLKQKTGVTDTQLDQRIEQGKLWSLAGLLGSYEKFVRKPGFGHQCR